MSYVKLQFPAGDGLKTRTYTVRDWDGERLTIDFVVHGSDGDPSVVPAISASLPRIPAGRPVHVLLQVGGPEDEVALESPGDLRVQWLHGGGDERLADAVRSLDFPAGAVHAFVHGEASAVRAVRRHLLAEREVPRETVSISGYWKQQRTEEGWREDKPEWNRLVEADLAAA